VKVAEGPTIVRDIDVALMPAPGAGIGTRIASVAHARDDRPDVSPADSLFTIEVSAASNARFVHAMVDELKEAGHAAYLVDRQAPGGNGVYHVRIGTYATRAEADRSARALEQSLGWRMSVMAVAPGVSTRNAAGYLR
jgi:cell division septation protein DedD